MRLHALFVIIVILITNNVFGQVGGASTYQFLNTVSSPIQDALGGRVVTSLGDDVNQALINPSTINASMDNRLGLNYGNYFADISFGTAAYGYSWGEKNKTIQAGVTYMNYGTFKGGDEFGNRTADFSGNEVALSVGYAYQLPIEHLTVGANVKLISSKLDIYNSFGTAIDLAALYHKKESNTAYTIVFRNMGTQITTYAGNYESLPFEVTAGLSQKLKNAPIKLHVTLQDLQKWKSSYSKTAITSETTAFKQTSFTQDLIHHINLGAEIFPERIITLRVGYNFRRSFELSNPKNKSFSGLSTGFGIRIKKFRFDYSYSRYSIASSTSLFGLQFSF